MIIGEIHYPALSTWVYTALTIWYIAMVVSCIVVVLSDNRNPIKSLAWVTALIFLPGVGLIFYFFFGRSPRNKFMAAKILKRRLLNEQSEPKRRVTETHNDSAITHLAMLADTVSDSPYTINNKIEIFTSGEGKFRSLCNDLRHARESILLQYYIFADDELGNIIADILIAKAKEGVTVKVIYDHVGSFTASNKFFRRMRKEGVDVHPFFRVTFPQLANRINWRNHRKLVIIDRRIGYIGGMNIAKRYIRGDKRYPMWCDLHFKVQGEIIDSLIYSFASDWNFNKHGAPMEIRPCHRGAISNNLGMQFVTTGPTDQWRNLSLAYLQAIAGAKNSIYIQTPYFLPPEALRQALVAAALAGIDVRLMIPRKSDSRMLTYASASYFKQCLQAGINIYLFEPGMLHSKCMIIDDEIVTCGSTNFDFRSFENNFEGNVFVYDKEFNKRMRDVFFSDMKQCTRLTLAQWCKRPRSERMAESVIRLFSPIL